MYRRNSTALFVSTICFAVAGSNLALAGTCGASAQAKAAKYTGGKNIVETAVAAGKFNTLATALTKADLVDALQGDGPFTVFAPTDEAFAKLPKGTLEDLLKPENKAKLQAILKYHVVSGSRMASDVVNAKGLTTLEGQRADISLMGNAAMIDGAKIVKTDIKASNGVIHVIDSVILPASDNIVTTAANAKQFNTLLAAAKAAGLAEVLANDGPFTVFAPTDEAFAALGDTVQELLKPANREKLASILKYHVVAGRVYSDQAIGAGRADTLQGGQVKVTHKGSDVMINSAKVVKADLDASNGVIHVIDAVLLPGNDQQTSH
jgi:transforming growth factor-beta-induced protein